MLTIILAMMIDIGSLKQQADLIEINTKHNEKGKVDFVQVILWEWSPDYRRYNVMRWYIADDFRDLPTRTAAGWQTKNYTAPLLRRSYTMHDPEQRNRFLHACEHRKNVRSRTVRILQD